MRREQLDLAERRDAQLHARAAELGADDALLHDPASLASWREVALEGDVVLLERHRLDARRAARRARRRARRRELGEVDRRVAAARHAVVELDDRVPHRGARRAHLHERVHHAVDVAHVLAAERMEDVRVGEQAAAARLGAEGQQAPDRRRRAGCPSSSATSRSSAARRVRDQVAEAGSGISAADLRDHPRPLTRPSRRASGASRRAWRPCGAGARAWRGITPGRRPR